jgi:membrane protease YdiL (CAAX protease family)
MQTTAKQRLILFLVLLVVFTAAAQVLAGRTQGVLASLLVMWTPGLAAIGASVLTRRSFREIGWRPWPLKWLLVGWLLPTLIALPAYALIWLTHLGGAPSATFLQRARFTLGMPHATDGWVIAAAFAYISLVNLLPSMLLSLGEEIGWRGFLVPELTKSIGFGRASLFSGLIWAAWHLPGILGGSYGAHGTPKLYQLACFSAMVISSGVILAFLRMKSGSIWPAVIMHATHNGVIQAFFDRITIDTGHTHYFTGEFGIALVPFTVALAYYMWHRAETTNADALSAKTPHPLLAVSV